MNRIFLTLKRIYKYVQTVPFLYMFFFFLNLFILFYFFCTYLERIFYTKDIKNM